MLRFELRGPAFDGKRSILFAALAVTVLVAALKFPSAKLYESFPDTDDALRIVLVRQLLAGQPWFENLVPRALPPQGLDIQWSRLVDGGIAGLILMFRTVVSPANAEAAARFTWPLIWLVPAVGAVLAMARRLGGSAALIVGLCLLLFNPPLWPQFQPGRIDHHNIQIALTLVSVACLLFSDASRWAAAGAGFATGAVLGVGFEALPFALLNAAAMGVWWAAIPSRQQQTRFYMLALCASVLVMYVAQTAPSKWMATSCDALSWNSVAAILVGAGGLLLATYSTKLSHLQARPWRVVAVAGIGALAAACFLSLRPICLRGPLADVDPRVWPLFLDHVKEMKPLWASFQSGWWSAALYWTPILGVALIAITIRNAERHRQAQWLISGGYLLMATALGILHVRMSFYAFWLSVPVIAGTVAQARWIRDRALVPSAFAALFASSIPPVLLVAMVEDAQEVSETCTPQTDVRALANLEPGLVFAHMNLGSSILANTSHSIVVAPYHQMTEGFVASNDIFKGMPDAARQRIEQLGVRYLALCEAKKETLAENTLPASLARGEIPAWLEAVPAEGPLRIYRVLPTHERSLVLNR